MQLCNFNCSYRYRSVPGPDRCKSLGPGWSLERYSRSVRVTGLFFLQATEGCREELLRHRAGGSGSGRGSGILDPLPLWTQV